VDSEWTGSGWISSLATDSGVVRISLGLHDVTVSLRGTPVLVDLSLTVDDGEMLTVVGPLGFGGTTLTRVAAGLLRPDSGTVSVGGRDVTAKPPSKRRVGLVPPGGGLLSQLTVEENISFQQRLRNDPRPFVQDNADHAIDRLHLGPVRRLRAHQISPERRLRAALARASVGLPEVLVVDVTAGAAGTAGLGQMIADANAGRSTPPSVLVCAHDPWFLADTDEVAVVTDGRVTCRGRTADLRRTPPDLATAALVHGTALALVGAVARGDTLDADGVTVPAPPGIPDGRKVVAALIPAALHLSSPADGLSGRVRTVRTEGVVTTVRVELADQQETTVRLTSTALPPPRQDDPVGIGVDPQRLLVFDAETPGRPLLAPVGGPA
jgi:ABC-type Fe3+/spermidine/putrescine transport system ATPase subunit